MLDKGEIKGKDQEIVSFVEFIVKHLVDYPDQVKVKKVIGDDTQTCIIELNVAEGDIGKVIGRKGKAANAMRTLLNAVAAKLKIHTVLQIVEPQNK